MEKTFGPNQVFDFLKLLIETGGLFYVDSENCIRQSDNDEPQGVELKKGDRRKIALYSEDATVTSDVVYLNPFGELIGRYPEKEWFFNSISTWPGCLALYAMTKIAQLAVDEKSDVDLKAAKAFAKFMDRIDKKFIDELQKIRPLDVGMIFYDKEKHIAQVLCDIFEDEWAEKMKGKLRKSSIALVREMLAAIFQTDDPAEIMYTATVISCPKFDAVVHTLVDALTRMAPIVEPATGLDLHVSELTPHLDHIEAYHKALQWMSSSAASPMKAKKEPSSPNSVDVPWKTESTIDVANPGKSFLERVSPAGVTVNPNYKNGSSVVNPTFGGGTGTVVNPNFNGSTFTFGGGGGIANASPVLPNSRFGGSFGVGGGFSFGTPGFGFGGLG